jgi:broad specificity phosphatase PhoE
MRRMSPLVAISILVTVFGAFAQSPAEKPPVTVFLVRHAEKGTEGADPSLTEAGKKRAESLAATLADSGITAIFSTEYKRTQETAAAVAKRLGVAVTTVPAKEFDALISKVRELAPGSRALVVGHSNTVPAAAAKLTGTKVAEMADTDFDRLYVATVRGGAGDVVLLHVQP